MPNQSENPRHTMRDVARHLGVSLMTVSLALRNSHRISESTRARVRAAAAELGYAPDPDVGRLMSRMRLKGPKKHHVPLALVEISDTTHNKMGGYMVSLIKGAEERARSLGYTPHVFLRAELGCSFSRLLGILRARGMAGIILLPPIRPMPIPRDEQWKDFAVVSTTGALTPHCIHRVVPHQFLDLCALIERLRKAGFRRIGFILKADLEERTLFHFTAAITLCGLAHMVIRPSFDNAQGKMEVLAWLAKHNPDVVVWWNAPDDTWLHSSQVKPVIYSISKPGSGVKPYLDERPEEIGALAAGILCGMIQNSEFGLPKTPSTTLIHGEFVDDFEGPPLDDPHRFMQYLSPASPAEVGT